jgi:hypothetical protein
MYVMAVTMLLSGLECRLITKQVSQIETVETRFLRTVAGYWRTGSVRN